MIASLGKAGVPGDRITWLAETEQAQAAGRSTKERVEQELVRLGGAEPGEQVLLVFIGHGSDAGEPKLNLPGPDLTAADLARVLTGYGTRPVAVVVAASSSGGFAEKLAAPGRLVITATRTGQERNETRFGHWFAQAFAGGAADIDKDGALSLLEAYAYTVREVKREYESDNRLLTEHARITDSTLARQFVFGAAGGVGADRCGRPRARREEARVGRPDRGAQGPEADDGLDGLRETARDAVGGAGDGQPGDEEAMRVTSRESRVARSGARPDARVRVSGGVPIVGQRASGLIARGRSTVAPAAPLGSLGHCHQSRPVRRGGVAAQGGRHARSRHGGRTRSPR